MSVLPKIAYFRKSFLKTFQFTPLSLKKEKNYKAKENFKIKTYKIKKLYNKKYKTKYKKKTVKRKNTRL